MSTKKRKESAEQEPVQNSPEDSEESEEFDSEDNVDFGGKISNKVTFQKKLVNYLTYDY